MEILKVTDDTTREELADALTSYARYAMRLQHHPDCLRWVKAHERMDTLLGELLARPVA